MNPFQTYYADIHKQTQALALRFPSGDCLIASKGCVSEVPVTIAARLIVEGTHALASDEQACAFRATQEMNRATTPQVDTLANARAQFAGLMAAKKGERA